MINAVLIDDEKNALELLEWQLHQYCQEVNIAACCNNTRSGIAAIQLHRPQLVFLDIEMPGQNGFELLQSFNEPFFDVIFTTAYNQFALKAFRFAALDYLLKPIAPDDLAAAVRRYQTRAPQLAIKQQLDILLQQYSRPGTLPEKVSFSTQNAIQFISPADILYCESNSNYTTLYFTDKTKMVVSRTLKEIEETLVHYRFYRIHHSYVVNRKHIVRYNKNDGGSIEMAGGAQLPVSRQRKQEIIRDITNDTQ